MTLKSMNILPYSGMLIIHVVCNENSDVLLRSEVNFTHPSTGVCRRRCNAHTQQRRFAFKNAIFKLGFAERFSGTVSFFHTDPFVHTVTLSRHLYPDFIQFAVFGRKYIIIFF